MTRRGLIERLLPMGPMLQQPANGEDEDVLPPRYENYLRTVRQRAVALANSANMPDVADLAAANCYFDIYSAWRKYDANVREPLLAELYKGLPNAGSLFPFMAILEETPNRPHPSGETLEALVADVPQFDGHAVSFRSAQTTDGSSVLDVGDALTEAATVADGLGFLPDYIHVWHLMSNVVTPALARLASRVTVEPGQSQAEVINRLRRMIRLGLAETLLVPHLGSKGGVALTKILAGGQVPTITPAGEVVLVQAT